MQPIAHPEVLARDWVPPVVVDRSREVAEIVRRLDPPRPVAPPPWIVGVTGASGSGTSAVARRAAREVLDRIRVEGVGNRPRLVSVRTSGARGTHGVAAALLRSLDEGFDGRGFPAAEILAGFLRRLRREGQPVVILLDDVHVGGPDLIPILRAVAAPDRFLPEAEVGLPPLWTLLAGSPEGWATVVAGTPSSLVLGRPIGLETYGGAALEQIVRDRWTRAWGHPPAAAEVARVVETALEDGGGAKRAIDLLRRAAVREGHAWGDLPTASGLRPPAVEVELRVVRAIEEAARDREAAVGDVRRREAELAEAQGARPLPATTLWRRIVTLERAGYVARAIRPGGIGGTRSVLRVLTPVEEWITASRRTEIRQASAPWTSAREAWPDLGKRAAEEGVLPGRPPVGPAD